MVELTEMANEIAISSTFTTLPEAPRADSDTQLLEICVEQHLNRRQRRFVYKLSVEPDI